MNPICQAFRDALDDPRSTPTSGIGAAVAGAPHAADCADCAAYVARAARGVDALGALERFEVPPELDGRVVAALQAGARQDRAVRMLESLSPQRADEQIDEAVVAKLEFEARHPDAELRAARRRAPEVLSRLVEEELADPPAARTRRYVGSMPRLEAPVELEAALALELAGVPHGAGSGPPGPTGSDRAGPALTPARGLMLMAAALALVVLLGPLRNGDRKNEQAVASQLEPRRTLRLQEASLADLERFSPVARDLVSGLGGGIVAARGREERPR